MALDRQAREPGFPVIPVLLARADPALGFLKLNTWVDLSAGVCDPEVLAILITAAIRGEPPGPLSRQRSEAAAVEAGMSWEWVKDRCEEGAPWLSKRGPDLIVDIHMHLTAAMMPGAPWSRLMARSESS